MKKLLTAVILFAFISAFPVGTLAQTSAANWNTLRSYIHAEIAVKTITDKTVFGRLREVNDDSIGVVVVTKSDSYDKTFSRADVENVWKAKIRFGRNTGKGALIGGAAGAAIGIGAVVANNRSSEPDGQAGVAVPVFGLLGAGIGAFVGFASTSRPRKGKVIYSR